MSNNWYALDHVAVSEEQIQAFIDKAKADPSIQEKLKSAKTGPDVVAIAKQAGFVVTVDELANAQIELSDEDLEGIAGGGSNGVCYKSCNN